MIEKIIIIGSGSISKKHKLAIKKIRNKVKLKEISSREFDKRGQKEIEKLISFKPELIIICRLPQNIIVI